MKISCTVIVVAGWLLSGQVVVGYGAEMSNSTALGDASAGAFTVVLLPDTQYYSMNDPHTYWLQTSTIAGVSLTPLLREVYNTKPPKMVIHLGDITDDGDENYQWENAVSAHAVLDRANIPYTVVPGNHDYPGKKWRERDTQKFNHYFKQQDFKDKWWYGGFFDKTHSDNSFAFFEEGDLKFLVVNLEYAPESNVLCWANALIRDHPTRRVIIVTHSYLGHDHKYCEDDDWSALQVWNELVRRHSNVFLVLCGHVGNSLRKNQTQEGPAREGGVKNTVYAILTDYQFESGKGYSEHGNGWLRTLRFVPSENRIYVRTFSVLPDVDRFNAHFEDDGERYPEDPKDDRHRYSLYYNMTIPTSYEYSAYGKTCNCSDSSHHNISFSGTMRVESGQDPFEILPGRTLTFRDGARLVVDGTLTAYGTDNDPIWFVSEQDAPIFVHKQERRVKVSLTLTITGNSGGIRMP